MLDIVFLIDRNLYYKYLAPLIDEALKSSLKVSLLHISHNSSLSTQNDKSFYYPQLNQIPQFHKKIQHSAMITGTEELQTYLKTHKPKLVFSLHPKNRYDLELPELKWVTVQHGIDSAKHSNQNTDYYICYTRNWLEDCQINKNCQLHEAGVFYANNKLTKSKEDICHKYNLDPQKNYFLFLPLPSSSSANYTFFPNKLYAKYHLRQLEKIELQILQYLSVHLKKQNTELIIKSRFKRLLPEEYKKFGHVVYDETFYPSTISEVCAISSYCYINFMPTATTIELASYNLPFTLIHYPKHDKYVFSHIKNKMKDIFLPNKPTLLTHYLDFNSLANPTNFNQNFSQEYISQYIQPKNAMGIDKIIETILKENFSHV